MNDPHGFTKENLLNALPAALKKDPKILALAGAIAGLLVRQKEETGRLSIYPQIDELDEALLDILAYDFKRCGDYLLENGLEDAYISMFEEHFFRPKAPEDVQNWCGGTGDMLSIDHTGKADRAELAALTSDFAHLVFQMHLRDLLDAQGLDFVEAQEFDGPGALELLQGRFEAGKAYI